MSQHRPHSPRCQALLEQLPDYLDGELAAALCAEIDQHLAGCDDCRVLVDTTRKTITLYHRHTPQPLPVGVEERLWQALEANGCVSPKNET